MEPIESAQAPQEQA